MFYNLIKKIFDVDNPEITFWTAHDGLEKIVPVLPAIKVIPDWFKKTPSLDKTWSLPTIKNCPAVPDLLKNAYIIRMWEDLKLSVTIDNKDIIGKEKVKLFKYSQPVENVFVVDTHGDNQFLDSLSEEQKKDKVFVWKLISPWFIKTSPGYSVLQLPVMYEFNTDFEAMPGIIDTDHHCQINQQVIQKKYGEIFIERGTPLVMYIPFKRTKYNFKCISETIELKKHRNADFFNVFTKFAGVKGGYKEKQKECPIRKNK